MGKSIFLFLALGCLLTLLAGFGYTVYGKYRVQANQPPVGRFIDIDGLALHYVDEGQGLAVVLLHGASTSLRDWTASLLPLLTKHYRVIAFDRPGHGYSERNSARWPTPAKQAELIGQALAQLDVKRSVWIGHSWSGSVVLAALLDRPDHVAAGVLLAGASHPWQGGSTWYNHVAQVPVLGALFAWTLVYPAGVAQLANAAQSVFTPNRLPDDYIDDTAIRLSLRPAAFLANAADLTQLSDFLAQQSQRYSTIRQPLLMITGTDDDIVPPWNHAERLIQQLPHAQLVYLDDTGHALHHVRTQRIADVITDFIHDTALDNRQ